MGPEPGHPKAEPHLWPLLTMGAILATQVMLLQVALNRLAWGLYPNVLAPAAGAGALAILAWVLYSQLDRDVY
ncbi:MAG TPA: hypothetical protein VK464_14925 [Symbiobacteriaceae bacterium]|jgi:hypothetical protein|nr:hypothetical protein [Symbiobacteriaceae bacterium]